MVKVKICGLKRGEDILYVNQLRPDYVGFVFADSKRKVDPDRAKELINLLDKNIKKVGVFLNNPLNEVKEILKICNLDILQFHGDEDPQFCQSFDKDVWKAIRIRDKNSIKNCRKYKVDGILLDTFLEGEYGGTGKTFCWDMVRDINKREFIILAGGLNVENVKDAIKKVNPNVLDVSSGVETYGVKDFDKIKKFIENVRGQDGY